ncbi:MAG: OsmC family peroxiredoxin [Pseudonocardiales bacterium]|nr:OsmC family peroxiredoxin [Pseudonocardiales bacterium]
MGTDRSATTRWAGGLADGSGTVSLDSSGVGSFDVSWPARTEEPGPLTSPEELIAAAHSSCYSMMLSHVVGEAGGTLRSAQTSAVVTFVVGEGITKIALTTRADVEGLDDAAFDKAVQDAKDQCPVSGLVKGNTEMTLDAARG